jgi:hypothetical protein
MGETNHPAAKSGPINKAQEAGGGWPAPAGRTIR